VPYFQALPCTVVVSVSSATAKETRRRLRRSELSIVTTYFVVMIWIVGVGLILQCRGSGVVEIRRRWCGRGRDKERLAG